MLAAHTPSEKREEAIFDIVNQVNRGVARITSQTERDQIAELNLIAGKRAKGATAYASALTYLNAGTALLAEDSWDRRRELIFSLELNRAECEFLTGQLTVAAERLAALSNRATTTVEKAVVACLRMDVFTTLDQSDRAVAVCLDYLRHIGIEWLPHPQENEVRREYERISSLLAGRTIEDLIDLPLTEDVACLATVDVLSKVRVAAGLTDANLGDLTICKAVSLSLERGNCDASCFAYVMLGTIAGPRFGDYQAGFRFGQLGYELVERRALKRFEASTYLSFSIYVVRWIKHVRASRDLLRRAFEAGNRNGDITFAAYACTCLNTDLLFAGEPLADVQVEAERSLAFAEKARFGLVVDCITTQLWLIRMLRGLTPKFGCFDDGQFNELRIEYHLSSTPALAMVACWYWIRKLQARYIAGDYAAAKEAASKAQPLLWTSSSLFEEAEYHFHGALVEAAYCNSAPAGERQQHIDAVAAHNTQLQVWAKNCPENFENRTALVSAEIARIQGRELEAEHLYEQAIRSAHENGFVHNEAIANELAAHFYAARGFERIAHAYLQDARHGYLRWGADGKVRQMDLKYPRLVPHPERPGSGPTLDTLIEQLDLTTVLKLSQAVAGEIEINRLIKILIETALEHAGAERGLLILLRGEGMWIEAEAITAKDTIEVNRQKRRVGPAVLPESVFQYVIRTRDSLLLDDAMDQEPFSQDPYIRRSRSRSILCLPLIKQAQLIGVLYLENGLASHVFTPARIALLRMLASQAATSLENARLYTELRDAEVFLTHAQRLSLTGSFCWRLDTDEITFSEELYRIFAFEQASAVTLERATARFHPEDVPLLKEKMEVARRGGSDLVYEIRLRMPDGSDKHLRTNSHVIRDLDGRLQCVGAMQDVTQHRLADEALSKARSELAHVSRMTSIGALTATIAHEITQPLAAIVTNADSCLIWLAKNQPNLDKARRAAERIVKDGHRAAEVIQSIRAQARRSASEMVLLDLSRLIVDTLELMQAELQRHEILPETRLVDDLALIKGDHTQLQQVIVNLLTNAIEAVSTSRRSPRMIRVSTESSQNGEVLTIVEDSGSGIDLQVLDRIFDPMFTTKPEGMGLGLSICRSIVEGHGGRLWVSPNPAGGSIFRFSIPVATTAISIEDASSVTPSAHQVGHPV